MHTATKVAGLALVLVVAGAATGRAQNNASMNVTANVFRPITVAADRQLVFGKVFPGQGPQGMPLGSQNAGHFRITSEPNASVRLYFVDSSFNMVADSLTTTFNV